MGTIEINQVKKFGIRVVSGIILIGISLGLIAYVGQIILQNNISQTASHLITSGIVIISAIVSVRGFYILLEYLYEISDESVLTSHQQEILYRFIQISVYISATILIIVSVWNIDLSSILIGAGVISVLAGLAAREALSSVLAGIIIMTNDMFKVGDWLQFEDTLGRVKRITFFNTHIISQHQEKHVIPNSSLTSQSITNISSQNRYRKDLIISVDYDENLQRAMDVCDAELSKLAKNNSTFIADFQSTTVKSFEDSGIELALKIWMTHPTPQRINVLQNNVYTAIHSRFTEENITIPYPQRTISNRAETQPDTEHKTQNTDIPTE